MAEFIDRKELREAFDNADADVVEEYEDGTCDWGFGRQNILEVINSVPTADVAPVRRGKWLPFRVGFWTSVFECSECHRRITLSCDKVRTIEMLNAIYPFCNCGARMDGDTNA